MRTSTTGANVAATPDADARRQERIGSRPRPASERLGCRALGGRRSCRYVPVALLVVLLLGSSAGLAARTVSARTCPLPAEMSDTTGHVLLRFMVLGGRVNFVKPLFVVAEPPEHADALVDTVRSCLKKAE